MMHKLKHYKMSLSIFGVAVSVAAAMGLFISCDNPFTSGMGDRVVIGRPTVSNIYPSTNSLLTGEVMFTGDAWAHRELHRVEVRIGNHTTGERFQDPGNPIMDWTSISVFGGTIVRTEVPGEGIDGNWNFTFNTNNLPENARLGGRMARPGAHARAGARGPMQRDAFDEIGERAMSEGMFRMRFRVWDNTDDPVYSEELVYTIKNLPSTVRMTLPDDETIIRSRTYDERISIVGGAPIQGQVIDIRGAAPGYPMIQIWPAGLGMPQATYEDPYAIDWNADHPTLGWASMFLVDPIAGINDDAQLGHGFYDRRHDVIEGEYVVRPVNVAGFSFRLSRFTVVPRDDGIRAAVFDGGQLEAGYYYFRIITRDTHGIVGHFPPLNHGEDPYGMDPPDPFRPGNPLRIFLINDAAPPYIELFVTPEERDAPGPNIYVTGGINERKISLDDPDGPERDVFRLRALATHNDGIARAELRWEHPERGSGRLLLESETGVALTADRRQVLFTFTANRDTLCPAGNLIFTSHTAAYTLTLRVFSRIGSWEDRAFTLVMDGEGPSVSMRPAIRGAYAPAAGEGVFMHGGFVNANPVSVNGVIQVSIDRDAASGIQRAKWFAEPWFDLAYPPEDSMLYRLNAFRRNPSHQNAAFFRNITNTGTSGLVNAPITVGAVPHEAYRTHNFKFDTLAGGVQDRQYMWLYAIAMDGVYNLGFAMQRIWVDQSLDTPILYVPGIVSTTADNPIRNRDDLRVILTGDCPDNLAHDGNWPRRNFLIGGQGITINMTDDDGITIDSRHIQITLTDLQTGVSRTLTDAQLGVGGNPWLSGSERARFGVLSQEIMASVLFGTGVARPPDGMYRLDITVRDSEIYKVQMEGVPPRPRYSEPQTFYFAVHAAAPVIDVDYPLDGSFQLDGEVTVRGRVRSPTRLQRLWISFYPNIMADPVLDEDDEYLWPEGPGLFEFYLGGRVRGENGAYFFEIMPQDDDNGPDFEGGPPPRGADGMYVYYWRKTVPTFIPYGLVTPDRDYRSFTLRAFDYLYSSVARTNRVEVDSDPPDISSGSFNQGRPLGADGNFEVWGNVHFTVTVADPRGIGSSDLPDITLPSGVTLPSGTRLADVRWWLLPYEAEAPTWNTPFIAENRSGTGGQFFARDVLSATFDAVFDSRELRHGEAYKIYVIAVDAVGNMSRPYRFGMGTVNRVEKIVVNRYADIPYLARVAPAVGPDGVPVRRPYGIGNHLHITGLVRDTDGFSPDNMSTYRSHVEIRFATEEGDDRWGDWLYVPGFLDGTGAMDFSFDIMTQGFDDGLIRYQIRMRDYDGVITGRLRNKNPQSVRGMANVSFAGNEQYRPQYITFLTGDSEDPFQFHFIRWMYPARYERESRLILDSTLPLIGVLPPDRGLFRNAELLLAALPGGTVYDANFDYIAVSFGGESHRLPTTPVSITDGEYNWNWGTTIRDRFTYWFANEAGQGSQSITFVAQDEAGNRSLTIPWNFTRDTIEPSVSLTSFNQGRPLNEDGHFEIWGNVHFALSVTDLHNLGSEPLPDGVFLPDGVTETRMSNVKWWLLPSGTAAPFWNVDGTYTPFPSGQAGTGGRFFHRGYISATFNAVFDSRYLADNATYNLFVIARDAAGNQSAEWLNEIPIRVNQAADFPVLDMARFYPGQGAVRREDAAGNLRITGIARDTDGFSADGDGLASDYVEILFRDTSLPGDGWGGDWHRVPGRIDGTGAIDFTFDVILNENIHDLIYAIHGDGDINIQYRIRITDEDGPITGRIRNKNPQNLPGNAHTFITAGNVVPTIAHALTARRVFPDIGYFSLILDRRDPEIGGLPVGGLFRNAAGLLAAFPADDATVTDANIEYIAVTFGGNRHTLQHRFSHLYTDGVQRVYSWNLDDVATYLETWFDGVAQGSHSITFVAQDRARNRSPLASWSFVKDTLPPEIHFTSFNQGRPREGGEYVVWGNVHFALNVTDLQGLGSAPLPDGVPMPAATTLSNVKWWLLPYDTAAPSWNDDGTHTPFPTGVNGTGGRFFHRGDLSATFEAVFNSLTLSEDISYRLHVIARDAAGNETVATMPETISVNQNYDRPILARLSPEEARDDYGNIIVVPVERPDAAGNLSITGLVRDMDGFAATAPGGSTPAYNYVHLQFSADGLSWGPEIPATTATIDPTGAIDFSFELVAGGLRHSAVPGLDSHGDGLIRYRIIVRDESGYIPGRPRSKNPQLDSGGNRIYTFITYNNALPYIPLALSAYYQRESRLILDSIVPEIDMTPANLPNMFRAGAQLLTAIPDASRTVTDANLRFLDVSFGTQTFRLLYVPSGGSGTTLHPWNWETNGAGTALEAWFNLADQGALTVSFVAEDWAGNRSPATNWNFTKDSAPPTVSLISFNQGRPLNEDGDFEIWGNVHFALSAADLNDLGSTSLPAGIDWGGVTPPTQTRLSNVKWWLLPYGTAAPSWNDDGTYTLFPSGVDGTGGRFFYRYEGNPLAAIFHATFDAVFNSRDLAGGAYNLYVIVRDAAGNQITRRLNERRIVVNQDADSPILSRLAPSEDRDDLGNVIVPIHRPDAAGVLNISGHARDTDGFSSNANNHVEIDVYTGSGWTGWLPVSGGFDPTGAINFAFNLMGQLANDGSDDGTIRYRIRISDYYTGGTEGRTKNPQNIDGMARTFLNTTTNIVPTIPLAAAGVRTSPADAADYHSLVLDTRPPEIGGIPNYEGMFRAGSQLLAAIPDTYRTVTDANFYFIEVSFGGKARSLPFTSSGTSGVYYWSWGEHAAALEAWFDSPTTAQGPLTVSFVAEDLAGNRTPAVSWNFVKDNQGPNLVLLPSRMRVIDHEVRYGDRDLLASDFPSNWPLDWPHGTLWVDWTPAFRATITNWPSDFAYLGAGSGATSLTMGAAVLAAIERDRADPFVIYHIRTTPGTNPVIRGRFDDRFGSVWALTGYTYVEYRFDSAGRNDTTVWKPSVGHLQSGDDHDSSFSWEIDIPLNDVVDGERLFDIRFSDTAGNWTYVFGIRFILDTHDPVFFVGTDPYQDRNNPDLFPLVLGPSAASERVRDGGMLPNDRKFSAMYATSAGTERVFRLQGGVHDANLRELTATIGPPSNTIVARVNALPTASISSDTYGSNNAPSSLQRLSLGPELANGGRQWSLYIFERDVYNFNDGRIDISLAATDLADRSTVVEWPFYLSRVRPVITFEQEGTINPGTGNPIQLRGSAYAPVAGVMALYIAVARYNHAGGDWGWFDGVTGAWNRDEPHTWDNITLPDGDHTWLGWNIQDMYELVPDIRTEGRYRMVIRATDRSLHWQGAARDGNPVETDLTRADAIFFVDRGGPTIRREPYRGDAQRTTFNTNEHTGNLGFVFDIRDPNTIYDGDFRVELRNAAGTIVLANIPVTLGGNPWDTGDRRVTVGLDDMRQVMNGRPDGQYTLFLVVRDAAGNFADMNHSWPFNLGNRLPELAVNTVNMLTYANAAFAGPVTIRGATAYGSGAIVSVQYTLIPVDDHDLDLTGIEGIEFLRRLEYGVWRGGYWNTENNPILEMEQYPGVTWTINIQNTRNITGHSADASIAGYVTAAANQGGLLWNGESIPGIGDDHQVHMVRLALRALDAAGNVAFMHRDLWIYPYGDRPTAEILWPEATLADGSETLLGGPFTIRGTASDNERVHNVFFRILLHGDPEPLSVPNFRRNLDGSMDVDDGYQTPRNFTEFGHGPGWYMASSTWAPFTDWWAPVNAYGELDPFDRDARYNITIQVLAKDAAYMGAGVWQHNPPEISDRGERTAVVVSGAPIFANEQIQRLVRHGDNGPWVPSNEWGLPLLENGVPVSPADGLWGAPAVVHMGGSGRATLRFEIRHEIGLGAILFREPEGREINLLSHAYYNNHGVDGGASIPNSFEHNLYRLNAPVPSGPGIAARVSGPGAPDAGGLRTWTVYVEVNSTILNNGYFMGTAGRFPLSIEAFDVSMPNPNRRTETISLPIDHSPPTALYELTVRPAGSASTLGGSAGAGAGDVGGVDRVVVWFQRYIGTPREYRPVSWWRDRDSGFAYPYNQFQPGETIRAYRPGAAQNQQGEWVDLVLPHIPPSGEVTGGYSAIVINRDDPLGTLPAQFGHRIATGWASGGGLGQIWNFTIDSLGLAPGPVNMHYVVFDRAGNATHQVQPLIIMNKAPAIGELRLATDIRGSAALRDLVGSSAGNVSGATGILDALRNYVPLAIPAGLTAEESDIRRGITPPVTPATQVQSDPQTGARHHIDNFTVRNNLLAMRVQTVQGPHEAAQRTFRVDYVSGATRLSGAQIGNIRAGMVYIVQNPGPTYPDDDDNQPIPWQTLGASHGVVHAGYAFLAAIDAPAETFNWGNASVWELNTAGPTISDHVFPENHYFANELPAAEFAFRNAAFGTGTGTGQIRDHDPANTGFGGTTWVEGYSLFIVKVFDGDEDDVFADFTLLSMRVNNNDQTPPFAQLYDLNPRAEHHILPVGATVPTGISPEGIGYNRTGGGLWRNDNEGNLSRPGHIEPRRIRNAANTAYIHSLTPTEMGEDPNAPNWESVNPAAFFAVDTVSGRVVLRGYAEDDQRVGGVVLDIDGTRVPILTRADAAPGTGPAGEPRTGLLAVHSAQTGNVFFTDTIDLYRHRVEWAFVWDTLAVPSGLVVGDITVRAIAVNATRTPDSIVAAVPVDTSVSPILEAGANAGEGTATAVRGAGVTARSHVAMRNFGFPANLQMYNRIRVNIRPYITGFRRDANEGFNNTRSLQGRFPFSRGETVVVTGFNLGGTGTTTVSLPGEAGITTHAPASGYQGRFGLSSLSASLYRRFQIPAGAVTGNGVVTLNVGGFYAANTSSERAPLHIQPWNAERSLRAGSDLWDNVTRVHIWHSDNATTGYNQGSFPASAPGWPVFGASMSIDPQTGVLHSSHNEGGGGGGANIGSTFRSTNADDDRELATVSEFNDPIINSSIFVGADGSPWVAYNVIGVAGGWPGLQDFGGIMVHGPGGGNYGHQPDGYPGGWRGSSSYFVESTWFNASSHDATGWPTSATGGGHVGGGTFSPAPLTQFRNPRVVTSVVGGVEHIHVVYFDDKDGSVKYRYNRRGYPGGADLGVAANLTSAAQGNNVRRLWTNLDGGSDIDDTVAVAVTSSAPWVTALGASARLVTPPAGTVRSGRAGEHNDIAVTSQGFPVIVYFDETNNRLRMAISNSVTPVAGIAWHIVDSVIPANAAAPFLALREGTGQYVSMRIDTRPNNTPVGSGSVQNRVHISAFNNITNSLVYIRGTVVAPTGAWTTGNRATAWVFEEAVVVGGVGNVGRRSAISLDEQGRPWIAFLDTRNLRGRDGVKVAFRDTALFPRAQTDMHGNSIQGWETMHVPAQFNVRDEQNFRFTSQLGMENFPTRNVTHTGGDAARRFWGAAVGFMSDDLFRIAYWVR